MSSSLKGCYETPEPKWRFKRNPISYLKFSISLDKQGNFWLITPWFRIDRHGKS